MTQTDDLVARLRDVPSCSAKQILRDLGVDRVIIQGPRFLCGAERAAGPARTVRFLPLREDVKNPKGNVQRSTIDTLKPGEVLVLDAMGSTYGAVLGDMLAARAKANGVEAVVADGVVRDITGLRAMGLTIHARGTHPSPSTEALMSWEADVTVQCGGTLVEPGDYIIADADAIVVVPQALAEEVAHRGAQMNSRDEFSQRLLHAGTPLGQAYPIPSDREEEYQTFARGETLRA